MATMQELRITAKTLGVPAAQIRKASTSAALSDLISERLNGGAARKPVTKKAPVRKATTPTRKTRTPAKKAAAVKKSTPTPKASPNGDAGRHVLGSINYNDIEGWNARPGSIPDLIIKSLRKHKGDRERVFNALVPDIWDYVGRKMADGSKRTQASAEDMLRYRISRTAWDFAMKTGQHEKSTNRATYGEGTRKAPAKKAAPASRKPATKKTAPAPTRKRATAQKPVQRRTRRAVSRTTRPVAKKKARR